MGIPKLCPEFFPLQDEPWGNTVGVNVADVFTCTHWFTGVSSSLPPPLQGCFINVSVAG